MLTAASLAPIENFRVSGSNVQHLDASMPITGDDTVWCRWVHPLIWAVVGVFILWGGFMQIVGWMEQVTHEGEPLVDFMHDLSLIHI